MNQDSFWARVQKTETCWIWTGNHNAGGYGRFSTTEGLFLAHRLAWEFTNGPIPDDLCVLHHCDNPPCVRPDHLFLGTRTDNANDKMSKGRTATYKGDLNWMRKFPDRVPKGESHPEVKLTDEQVRQIRETYAKGGISQREVAQQFGCSQQLVSLLTRGRRRKTA